MSLTQDLANLNAQNRDRIPAEAQAAMGKATQDLASSGILDRSLKAGDRAPNFTLPNAIGNAVELNALLAQGPVVVSFYRGQWCPYCNLELRALQQALPAIQQQGATLVAISPQTPDNSLSTAEKNELSFEVLSDAGNNVAREFGLVFQLPAKIRHIYEGFGIDLPGHNGDETFELPVPATYTIAPNGTVTSAFVNADYTQRLDPTEIIATLKALPINV